jgi:hypothetical protein
VRRPLLPFLPLLLAACAGPHAPAGKLRPVGQLPEDYRDTWVAWVDQDPAWPEIRARALEDPRMTRFLVDNLARIMLRAYRGGAIAGAHEPEVGPFERSRAELARIGAPAVPTLAELMAIGDGSAALLCGDLLVEIGSPALGYAPQLLERDSALERERAAALLGRLPHAMDDEGGLLEALALRLEEDPEWTVRKASAEALGYRGSRHVEVETTRKVLSRALTDAEPEVARAAAFALARLADPAGIPSLLNYLERCDRSADLLSYEAGQRALRALSGATEAWTPRQWRDWWRTHRPAPSSGGKR